MLLSLVIPIFNEEDSIPILLSRLDGVLQDIDWEVLFVNDGSSDASLELLHKYAAVDTRVKVLTFSRNFGHQAAVTAGLDFAEGDAVIVMDADLQDPPEIIPEMLRLYREGYDVVSPRRMAREGETMFKRWTATVFYRLMASMVDKRLTPDVGDFRLFSRRAVLALRTFREQHRFMRGLVAWLGLKEAIVPFTRKPRVAGETKYPLFKMLCFAWTAIASFSALPLKLCVGMGVFVSSVGFAYLLRVLYLAIWTDTLVPGWASVVVMQAIFSGMILVALGLVGDYVARTYEESKGRPLYVVPNSINVAVPEQPVIRASVLMEPHSSAVNVETLIRGVYDEERHVQHAGTRVPASGRV